jgi:AAA family ATP:ADP antiporter
VDLANVWIMRRTTKDERIKIALLGSWFFTTIAIVWILKAFRTGSLLAHLGAAELPYVRFGAVAAVALTVAIYSRIADRCSRVQLASGASVIFAAVLVAFWSALLVWGEALGAQRWFVWAVFILVDIYSTVMVGIFWTYSNDIVSRAEADRLYGPIGIGGIVGGIVAGATVDSLVRALGPVHLLLLAAALSLLCAAVARTSERLLEPAPRAIEPSHGGGATAALAGAREVLRSRYLLLLVGIVLAYEFTSATTDFAINVIFQRSFEGQTELAKMTGRLGWIVSGTALISQLVLVPLVLPRKRLALLLPPLAMALPTLGLLVLPAVSLAFLLAASDRGLNYSVHQATKETLYVPLTDVQKYKSKAFIDMVVDRGGKAVSSVVLMIIIASAGVSLPLALAAAVGSIAVWSLCAAALGREYRRKVGGEAEPSAPRRDAPPNRGHRWQRPVRAR